MFAHATYGVHKLPMHHVLKSDLRSELNMMYTVVDWDLDGQVYKSGRTNLTSVSSIQMLYLS